MTVIDRLVPPEVRATLPPLYAQEHVADPIVHVKWFTPDAGWTWYLLEWDGEDLCFGWVVGPEAELGYFSLAEIGAVRGPYGLLVERDRHFRPNPLSVVQRTHP